MGKMIIDASLMEGGGQVVRTSLALASILGKKTLIENIRIKRPNPGLAKQHLAGIITLKEITNAKTDGIRLGSKTVLFEPKEIQDSDLNVNIGSAGSLGLLFQQLLPLALKTNLQVRGMGGTHVPFSPSITFMRKVLLHELKAMGMNVSIELLQTGFYPKGKGRALFKSKKTMLPLKPIKLFLQGKLGFLEINSFSSGLPSSVSRNQAVAARKILKNELGYNVEIKEKLKSAPDRTETIGASIDLIAGFGKCRLASNAVGKKGDDALNSGHNAAKALVEQIKNKNACDYHLADQLIPFMALAEGRSEIKTSRISNHCLTNIKITERFLGVKFEVEEKKDKQVQISVEGIGFK